jgi:hypothetical protein
MVAVMTEPIICAWRGFGELNGGLLDAQILRQPQFRFVHDFFQATEAGEREAVDRERADFAHRCVRLEGRSSAFLVNKREHRNHTGSTRSWRRDSMCSGLLNRWSPRTKRRSMGYDGS